jgi:hypothetical protein
MIGASKSLGMALLRLHSEYDGASRLREDATMLDVAMLAARLRGLPGVVGAVTERAAVWGMEQPKDKALAVVLWVVLLDPRGIFLEVPVLLQVRVALAVLVVLYLLAVWLVITLE